MIVAIVIAAFAVGLLLIGIFTPAPPRPKVARVSRPKCVFDGYSVRVYSFGEHLMDLTYRGNGKWEGPMWLVGEKTVTHAWLERYNISTSYFERHDIGVIRFNVSPGAIVRCFLSEDNFKAELVRIERATKGKA